MQETSLKEKSNQVSPSNVSSTTQSTCCNSVASTVETIPCRNGNERGSMKKIPNKMNNGNRYDSKSTNRCSSELSDNSVYLPAIVKKTGCGSGNIKALSLVSFRVSF